MADDLLTLNDLDRGDLDTIFAAAARLKDERQRRVTTPYLAGKSIGMLFYKSSTRTRISFEVGMFQLGGYPLYLDTDRLQMGRGETLADSAKIFSRYLDGLVIRTYDQKQVEELAAESAIPVINALTDHCHPCQIVADLFTIREKRGSLDGVKVAYIGDGNNIANSWLLGAGLSGVELRVATPNAYAPDPAVVTQAMAMAEESGGSIILTDDPKVAAHDADVLYTDTWISMGQADEAEERRATFADYQVNADLLAAAKNDAIVMHCLPAHRGEEISADVMDGPQSVVWDEAENRLYVQQAIMTLLIDGPDNDLFG